MKATFIGCDKDNPDLAYVGVTKNEHTSIIFNITLYDQGTSFAIGYGDEVLDGLKHFLAPGVVKAIDDCIDDWYMKKVKGD